MFKKKQQRNVVDVSLLHTLVWTRMKTAEQCCKHYTELANACLYNKGKTDYARYAIEDGIRHQAFMDIYDALADQFPEFRLEVTKRRIEELKSLE